jgi:hypothetical protein
LADESRRAMLDRLHEIYERWIGKYERRLLQALRRLKSLLETGEPIAFFPCGDAK